MSHPHVALSDVVSTRPRILASIFVSLLPGRHPRSSPSALPDRYRSIIYCATPSAADVPSGICLVAMIAARAQASLPFARARRETVRDPT